MWKPRIETKPKVSLSKVQLPPTPNQLLTEIHRLQIASRGDELDPPRNRSDRK